MRSILLDESFLQLDMGLHFYHRLLIGLQRLTKCSYDCCTEKVLIPLLDFVHGCDEKQMNSDQMEI